MRNGRLSKIQTTGYKTGLFVVKLKFIKSKHFTLQKTSLGKQNVNNKLVENTHEICIRQRTSI